MDYLKTSGVLYEKYGEASFICNTHEIYYTKNKENQYRNVILYHKGFKIEINLGVIGPNKDATLRNMYGNNECICFYDIDQNGKTSIKYLFNIPSATFINGEEELLDEMFLILFGTPFNIKEEIPKPMVRHITLKNTSQEN